MLFLKYNLVELNATTNKSTALKTFNQPIIEKHSRWSLKIRHNDKCVKCRFYVVPLGGPVLLGMPDIKLLEILMIMCEEIDHPHECKKFDSQCKHPMALVAEQTKLHRS